MRKGSINPAVLTTALALLLTTACALAEEKVKGCHLADLARRATEAERAGCTGDAISAYEELLRQDPSYNSVAAPRLVELYTASGQASHALAWARKAAPGRPDPQAYLACVYASLGQFKEAEMILRQAVTATSDCEKLLPLLWQMADVQEKQGDYSAALATLNAACTANRNESMHKTSLARLPQLQARQRPQKNDSEAQP
ncbi:MAG: hypothetical protein PHU80_02020 [Kiritimatiellae bacterium]|nr:hypothetical protein [Kiritimatiellia bacterium]